jgi:hypothetical protein
LSFFGRNPEVLGIDKDFANYFDWFSLIFFFNEPPIRPGSPSKKIPPNTPKSPKPSLWTTPPNPGKVREKNAGGEVVAHKGGPGSPHPLRALKRG